MFKAEPPPCEPGTGSISPTPAPRLGALRPKRARDPGASSAARGSEPGGGGPELRSIPRARPSRSGRAAPSPLTARAVQRPRLPARRLRRSRPCTLAGSREHWKLPKCPNTEDWWSTINREAQLHRINWEAMKDIFMNRYEVIARCFTWNLFQMLDVLVQILGCNSLLEPTRRCYASIIKSPTTESNLTRSTCSTGGGQTFVFY
ncbi:uncharacterized protein LOC115803424 [Delphinapterus leucas]|uniref:Uncharacterized protein LOC115803424 n=1 Tax=Delphinapterus leucas TaxID=9749 RepID=A0A7F8KG46_DELLE|nr:uncharacterized protein LOC115803424 [Delphinapterus leucas]